MKVDTIKKMYEVFKPVHESRIEITISFVLLKRATGPKNTKLISLPSTYRASLFCVTSSRFKKNFYWNERKVQYAFLYQC